MSDFLRQAIEDALREIEQRIHDAVEEQHEPVIVESTANVLDATPVLLPMPGEKETR